MRPAVLKISSMANPEARRSLPKNCSKIIVVVSDLEAVKSPEALTQKVKEMISGMNCIRKVQVAAKMYMVAVNMCGFNSILSISVKHPSRNPPSPCGIPNYRCSDSIRNRPFSKRGINRGLVFL